MAKENEIDAKVKEIAATQAWIEFECNSNCGVLSYTFRSDVFALSTNYYYITLTVFVPLLPIDLTDKFAWQ
ncbi:hypothetical protein AAHA92_29644 [Salvia divinorum]|uniref:Uncharacterized protein n=1 Tax=Salvia divinorum TaxID=28513 RepID=A0ABD1FZ13_SALDI